MKHIIIIFFTLGVSVNALAQDSIYGPWKFQWQAVYIEILETNKTFQCRIAKNNNVITATGNFDGVKTIEWEPASVKDSNGKLLAEGISWGMNEIILKNNRLSLSGPYGTFTYDRSSNRLPKVCGRQELDEQLLYRFTVNDIPVYELLEEYPPKLPMDHFLKKSPPDNVITLTGKYKTSKINELDELVVYYKKNQPVHLTNQLATPENIDSDLDDILISLSGSIVKSKDGKPTHNPNRFKPNNIISIFDLKHPLIENIINFHKLYGKSIRREINNFHRGSLKRQPGRFISRIKSDNEIQPISYGEYNRISAYYDQEFKKNVFVYDVFGLQSRVSIQYVTDTNNEIEKIKACWYPGGWETE